MSQIDVNNLTFYYEGSSDNIFEHVSFSVDTDWKLGFLGRNGKGKTTFLKLLLGKYEYSGSIHAGVRFDYFPYEIQAEQMECCGAELLEHMKADCELWRVCCELERLGMDTEVLYRPFGTLSHGERTKVMLAVLFSGTHDFLLIDEPTNHLDGPGRALVAGYLKSLDRGFLLVSHDRAFLDGCVDHILALNQTGPELVRGTFSSWFQDKENRDRGELARNEKLKGEIRRLEQAAKRTSGWSDKVEQTKYGSKNSGLRPDRGVYRPQVGQNDAAGEKYRGPPAESHSGESRPAQGY